MSGFAFSHQFSQRWLATPAPIKATIIQELDDIVNLLHSKTDVDIFRFSVSNLHDKVEELMAIEAEHQAQLLAEQRQREQERAEQERLEHERLEQERLKQLAQQRLEQDRLEVEALEQQYNLAKKTVKKKPKTKSALTDTVDVTAENTTEVLVKTPIESEPTETMGAGANLTEDSLTVGELSPTLTPDLEALKQQIIADIQHQLEGYLSGIKADIAAWLEDEVTKQLSAKLADDA